MCWMFLFLFNSANCLTRTTVCNWHYPRQIQVPRIHFIEPWTTLEITDSQHNECQQRQKTVGVFLYIIPVSDSARAECNHLNLILSEDSARAECNHLNLILSEDSVPGRIAKMTYFSESKDFFTNMTF